MKIVLKNGHVYDKRAGLDQISHLIVEHGRIAGFGDSEEDGDVVIDCRGRYVIPEIIDMHTHCFSGSTNLGVDKNRLGLLQNIGTIVDAGSAGAEHFELFRQQAKQTPGTRVYAFINYSKIGLTRDKLELSREEYFDEEGLGQTIRENPDVIRGIKLRASASVVGELGMKPIRKGLEFAHKMGLPAMVHIGNCPPSIEEVLEVMKAGDIVTHSFHGKAGGILDGRKVKREVWEARERGVLFDVGHGSASFDAGTAEAAIAEGFLPDLVSSDSHARNFQKTISGFAMILNRLAECGMTWRQIFDCVTGNAAEVLRIPGQIRNGEEARLNLASVDQSGALTVEGLVLGEMIRLGGTDGKNGCGRDCK